VLPARLRRAGAHQPGRAPPRGRARVARPGDPRSASGAVDGAAGR
jgi:hypothetical protein